MVFVLTLDQRSSRRRADEVEALLARLGAGEIREGVHRPFERTAGDEAQGVVVDPRVLVDVVAGLLRTGIWHIGLGIGPVDEPLPASTRAGRGPAFLRARQAVNRAKTAPHRISVVGDEDYRAEHVETVFWLLAAVLARRSERGWEVADLLAQGRTRGQVAETLGVSASAVSQRVQAAGVVEERRARDLLAHLLADADQGAEQGADRVAGQGADR
jgi:hypothetical protein